MYLGEMADIIDIFNRKIKERRDVMKKRPLRRRITTDPMAPPPNPSPKRSYRKLSDESTTDGIAPPSRRINNVIRRTDNLSPKELELLGMVAPVTSRELGAYRKKVDFNEDPLGRDIKLIDKYQKNPLAFPKYELGLNVDAWREDRPPVGWKGGPLPLPSYQRKIIRDVFKHRWVAVKSCHGPGKTYIAAVVALTLHYVFRAVVITTAPSFRQVRKLLWEEIHYHYNRARNKLGGRLNQTELISGDKWYMMGFATDSPEFNISGIHEETVVVVVDEAGGVDLETFNMMDTLLTSKNVFVLYIGNPIVPEGPFYDAFKPGSGFHQITIPAWITPNVRHNKIIYPKLVTKEWVDKQIRKHGRESNWVISRVDAEFPESNLSLIIPLNYLEASLNRDHWDEKANMHYSDKVVGFAVDVARSGADRTPIGKRWQSGRFRIIDVMEGSHRTTEVVGRVKRHWEEARPHAVDPDEGPFVTVDDTGVGGGVTDMLVEDGIPTNGFVSSEAPDGSLLDQEDYEDAERFANMRALGYWKLRKAAITGQLDIEDDVAAELGKIQKEDTRKDKIKIEDKEKIKKRLRGLSPDLADTAMIAFAYDRAETSREMVRFINF